MLPQLEKMSDRDLAQLMCGAAFDAYTDDTSYLANSIYKADSVHLIERDEVECKVWIAGDVALIAFRGTEPSHLVEWIRNLKFRKISMGLIGYQKVRVHRGFIAEFESVRNDLLTLLFASNVTRVYLTGHSKGAAQATIAAMWLNAGECFQVEQCVVFGSPMVGNSHFARKVRHRFRLVRYENCNDVVPRIPRWWMGYVHAGSLRYIAGDGEIIECPSPGIVFWDRIKSWRFGKSISDHFILNYLRGLLR